MASAPRFGVSSSTFFLLEPLRVGAFSSTTAACARAMSVLARTRYHPTYGDSGGSSERAECAPWAWPAATDRLAGAPPDRHPTRRARPERVVPPGSVPPSRSL